MNPPAILPQTTETACRDTVAQMKRLLRKIGITESEPITDRNELCNLVDQVYKAAIKHELVIVPQMFKQLRQHRAFLRTLTYLQRAVKHLPLCFELSPLVINDPQSFVSTAVFQQYNYVVWNDAKTQRILHCLLREILSYVGDSTYINPPESHAAGVPLVIQTLKNWLYPIQKLEKGKYGQTYTANYRLLDVPLVIIKSPLRDDDEQWILHELAIGYALNTIRQEVGSWFMYCYGGFFCEPESTDSLSCSSTIQSGVKSFVLFQAVSNSTSLYKDILKRRTRLSQDQMYDVLHYTFLQLASALWTAQHSLKFVHFDLHGGNVLVRGLPEGVSIPIRVGAYEAIIDNVEYLPTIIDYGMSVCIPPGEKDALIVDRFSNGIVKYANSTQTYFTSTYDLFNFITSTLISLYQPFQEPYSAALDLVVCQLIQTWLTYFATIIQDTIRLPSSSPPTLQLYGWITQSVGMASELLQSKVKPEYRRQKLNTWRDQFNAVANNPQRVVYTTDLIKTNGLFHAQVTVLEDWVATVVE
jgi:hypothetical protein